ncbi:hypothetical protein GGI19_005252 [Coemansia pectinata]|uniref:Swi5-dependent recombination DNA repair protein 1 n=1 Tax=Coemansia pectinata TaxID=1052879 RepID=A0A9W8L9S3_9FUNG|nr:hypothetical protein GGI19_005252 [Coemansia pectinata]
MQRAKMSQKVLAKPFKSPSRTHPTVKPDTTANTEASTPTPTTRKRPMPGSLPPAARKLDLSTPLPSNKRPRIPQTTAISSKRHQPRRLSTRGLPPRFAYRDEDTLALLQEKNSLQRQVAEAKEEVALLERALTLDEKKEADVVNGLIDKWQTACSSASDELFDLLKPMMEAQRQADQMGFGGNPFADDSAQQPKRDTDEAEDEDIDIPYMLKRFGIDPELFTV